MLLLYLYVKALWSGSFLKPKIVEMVSVTVGWHDMVNFAVMDTSCVYVFISMCGNGLS